MFAIYLMFLCKFPFAKVRRNLHSHNTLCMAFLYTKRLVFGIFFRSPFSPCRGGGVIFVEAMGRKFRPI